MNRKQLKKYTAGYEQQLFLSTNDSFLFYLFVFSIFSTMNTFFKEKYKNKINL